MSKVASVIRRGCWPCFRWYRTPSQLNNIHRISSRLYQRVAGVPDITFSNGEQIPQIGYGTWKTKPEEAAQGVKWAIEAGYRHIDCAYVYLNEKEVGQGLKAKFDDGTVKREDMFITGKVWNSFHGRHLVKDGLQASLDDLGLDYLDLYLIHWPHAYKEGTERFPKDKDGNFIFSDASYTETWKGMEDLMKTGRVKSIGLSNFNIKQVQDVLDIASIKPVCLQIEVHPYFKQTKMREFCKRKDIAMIGYSPIGSRDRPWVTEADPYILEDPKVVAIANRLGRTPAQVALRWGLQRGTIVIPKSVTQSRIKSNFQLADFSLTDEDMTELSSFDEKYYRGNTQEWLSSHPFFPFNADF